MICSNLNPTLLETTFVKDNPMGKKPSGKKQKKAYVHEKIITVHCQKCPAFIDEKYVEFINIEEDFQGFDVLTFRCPKCGTQQKSKRFG
jgi:predicted RNA-binding Zn-ribbon protein involved in translation (DUF1610 family)